VVRRILLIVVPVILIALIIIVALNFGKAGPRQPAGENISPSSANSLAQAKDFESKGKLLEAKAIYQKIILDSPNSRDILNWQKKLDELNIAVLFSNIMVPNKTVSYEIKPGDSLYKIAKEFKTTVELIVKSNKISGDTIIPGKKIRVWKSPFSILVYKSQNILILKSEDEIMKTYTVSTGANNCSPVGTFKIVNKLENPTWFKAGAVVAPGSSENVLGSRWMGFNLAGYGIHGTVEPQSLGQQVTQGCVRMANSEVDELYAIVPVDTEVTIVE
jgi:lipoprotein-anchoring transpeptidase ErfK/SrfK